VEGKSFMLPARTPQRGNARNTKMRMTSGEGRQSRSTWKEYHGRRCFARQASDPRRECRTHGRMDASRIVAGVLLACFLLACCLLLCHSPKFCLGRWHFCVCCKSGHCLPFPVRI